MDNLVIIPFTLKSHITASLGMAKTLKSNYEVIYAVPETQCSDIEKQGFSSYLLGGFPFGYGFEYINRVSFEDSKDGYLDALLDRISDRIYLDRQAKLMEMVESIKPAIVLI